MARESKAKERMAKAKMGKANPGGTKERRGENRTYGFTGLIGLLGHDLRDPVKDSHGGVFMRMST